MEKFVASQAKPFSSILVALAVWNQAGVREKQLHLCRDFEVPSSNLAWAPFFVSFSLCFSISKLSEIIRAGGREFLKKRNCRTFRVDSIWLKRCPPYHICDRELADYFKVPGSNLAYAPFVDPLSSCFSTSRLFEIIRAWGREFLKKISLAVGLY